MVDIFEKKVKDVGVPIDRMALDISFDILAQR